MNQVVPFNFENTTLRVVTGDNGEPLFVGKDLCEALGYKDTTNAMKQHCRGVVKHHPIVDSLGRTQEARVLTEADMFRLIVNSNLPAAERFEAWVFEEVLPSIRKTGSYGAAAASTKPLRATDRYRDAAVIASASIKLCKLMGVETNMARVITADLVQKEAGIDCTPMLGSNIAVAEVPVIPSKLGESLGGVSGRRVNALLLEAGLQTKLPDGSYLLTEAGKEFGVMEPFKSPNSQHVGHRPMWYERAIEPIKALMASTSNVVQMQVVA